MTHVRRPPVTRHKPHHVTVRVTRATWNLRSQRCFRPIVLELARASRSWLRIVHFSVQRDHIHLIVEADDRRAMSKGLRTLFARIACRLNALMGASGPRFTDRYHEHILATPREARNAVYYVLGNRAHHLSQRGHVVDPHAPDPFSSVVHAVVVAPTSWLLREGWTRAGP